MIWVSFKWGFGRRVHFWVQKRGGIGYMVKKCYGCRTSGFLGADFIFWGQKEWREGSTHVSYGKSDMGVDSVGFWAPTSFPRSKVR